MFRRTTLFALLTALLATAMLAPGCARALRREAAIAGATDATGPLAVDVSNFRGSVRLVVDDRLEQASVTTNLRPGPAPEGEKIEPVDLQWATAEIVDQEGGRVLRVVTEQPPEWPGQEAYINLVVRVPRCEGVRIHNSDGRIAVFGGGGTIEIVNGVGGLPGDDIFVKTSELVHGPVTLRTSTGQVTLKMGAGSRGVLDLATDDGEIMVRSRGSLEEVHVSHDEWRGVLNGGAEPIVVRTGEGDVIVEDGRYSPAAKW